MLTGKEKRFFDENGYLVLEQVFSPEEVAVAREEMNALLREPEKAHPRVRFSYESPESANGRPEDPDNPRRVWMLFDTPLAGDWWFRQAMDVRVVDAISDCLGVNIDFHNGKARIKPPGYQSHQGWHQDWPYERHSRPELAAAIFYLDDTWDGAAATRVAPGSHLQGEWRHDENNIIPNEAVTGPALTLCARAGDVAIIHVLVVHRAGHNDTDQSRSCIINEYKTHEAIDQWGNNCAFAELPLRRNGEAVL
ncbi:MAG TPA: phytanoyl-CoA dioxygenase family protein [Armatimonadota bacterium]|nr:phytanoyl-CoA dioxygenase family protein [Armatimonadota bacterium]